MASVSAPLPCLCSNHQVAVVFLDNPTDSCSGFTEMLHKNAFISTNIEELNHTKESKTSALLTTGNGSSTESVLKAFLLQITKNQPQVSKILLVSHKPVPFVEAMQYINCLYRLHSVCDIQLCAALGPSFLQVLPSGYTEIWVNSGHEGKYCGLVPLGHQCKVTTTGLKWNLDNMVMEFSDLVSTSNALDTSGKVTVQTNHPLVWYLDIKPQS